MQTIYPPITNKEQSGQIYVKLDNNVVKLSKLNKVFDSSGVTKAQIIDYYLQAHQRILPHILNKPFSMYQSPNGTNGKSFYAKRKPANAPSWLKSTKLPNSSIDWCLVNDLSSIIYMVNRGVIEMHTFLSRLPQALPDIAVIDLDPSGQSTFLQAVTVAKAFRTLLHKLKLFSVIKTSGGDGLHIYIPIFGASFAKVLHFLSQLSKIVESTLGDICTSTRTVNKRGNKIYIDILQNAHAKTIACPYTLRCRPNLPFSAPLQWEQLDTPNLDPSMFTLSTLSTHLSLPDPFKDFYTHHQPLPTL